MSEQAEKLVKQLNNTLSSLKKSNNIKSKTLLDKRQSARDLNSKINILLLESSLSDTQLNAYVDLSKSILSQIEQIINQKLSLIPRPPIRFLTVVKILVWLKIRNRNMALDIKTASELASLIPTYDGNPGGMKSFTDAITLIETIVPAAQQAAAIQLILTKLTGKARNLFAAVPADYQEIKNKITADCSDKSSSDLALANLKNIKPRKGQETSGFVKEMDVLAEKLIHAYIREEVPNEVAKKLANKAAIQTLINVSQKQETKMMLKVGKFASLAEALNIVVENENFNNDQSASMLYFKKNFQHKGNYQQRFNDNMRGNFRNFRGSHQRGSHQPRPNFVQQSFNRFPRFNNPNNHKEVTK